MKRDYYVVLGIPRTESAGGIRAAYRDLARRYHPDRAGDAGTPFFREVAEAYRILSDPARRASYDCGLRDAEDAEPLTAPPIVPQGSGQVPEPPVPEPISVMRDFEVTAPSLEEVLHRFVDNFLAPHERKHRRLDALGLNIIISPTQAAFGGALQLAVPVFRPCARCHGTGGAYGYECLTCQGAGMVEEERPVTVYLPPGVSDGSVFQVPLRGLGIHNMYLEICVRVDQR